MKKRVLKVFAAIIVWSLVAPAPLWAQVVPAAVPPAKWRPFAKKMFASKDEYIKAVRECDKSKLYVACDSLVIRASELFKLKIDVAGVNQDAGKLKRALGQVAEYMEGLVQRDCSQVREATLDAAEPNGLIIVGAVTRKLHPKEQCLVDTNRGDWAMSLMCGNFIVGYGGVYPTDVVEIDKKSLTESMKAQAKRDAELAKLEEKNRKEAERLERERARITGGARGFWTPKKVVGGLVGAAIITGIVAAAFSNENTAKAVACAGVNSSACRF